MNPDHPDHPDHDDQDEPDWRSMSPDDRFKFRIRDLVFQIFAGGVPADGQATMDRYLAEHDGKHSFVITDPDDPAPGYVTVDGWDVLDIPVGLAERLRQPEPIHVGLGIYPTVPDTVAELFGGGDEAL